ncbi:MAG TPA: hypothetical protein VMZ69_09150 [Saprospiraceae bacterium]|nr:hypothetical protein [Saprospiraceae bacterium]
MRYLLFILVFTSFISCQNKGASENDAIEIQKSDLARMRWITGTWVGDYKGRPFYETYEMSNDSTLRIVGYEHVGTDTSSFNETFVYWKDGEYYMGQGPNYKVTKLDEKEVRMMPLQASNEILWTSVNDSTWTALLPAKTDTAFYTLRRVSPAMDTVLMSIASKAK